VLGRHRDCDLIVRHNYVSRRHATIECKRGKFFMNDHSSNGSYVSDKKKQFSFLRRDMMQLRDNGSISLGIEPDRNLDHIIKYAVTSNSVPM
jgi:predicted component of type VI protein secretion system